MAKTERKKLMDELDKLSKDIAKIRDRYTCQRCHKQVSGVDCQGSHVIPVSAGSKLKWDTNNIKTLCYHCHLNWWHKNPIEAFQWFSNKFPERLEYLNNNRGIVKYSLDDLKKIKDDLTIEKIAALKYVNEYEQAKELSKQRRGIL